MDVFTEAQPDNLPIASVYNTCIVQVGIEGMPTGMTFKKSLMTEVFL
jgi:hypothetical protein